MALPSAVAKGFEDLLATNDPKAIEDALYANAEGDILKQYQGNRETAYGRGLGISTIAAQINQSRDEALARARRDAFLAGRQASTAALATAAGKVATDQNRETQQGQFDRSMQQQKSLANQQMIGQGVGGLMQGGSYILGRGMGADGFKGLFGSKTASPSAPGLPGGYAPLLTQGGEDYGAALNTGITMPDVGGGFDWGSSADMGGGMDFGSSDWGGGFDTGDWGSSLDGDWGFSGLSNPWLSILGEGP